MLQIFLLAILTALEGKPIPVYGDGGNVRDWLYVEDHARALVQIALLGQPGECYNVGGASETANLEVVRRICRLMDEMAPDETRGSHERLVVYVTDRPGHDRRYAIDAGKVKPLAIMDANPPALYPNLPTLKKELGSNWQMAAWRVIAAPKGLPADVHNRLVTVLKKVHDSKEFRDFMAKQGFGVIWAGPQDAAKFMAKSDSDLGAVMKAVGIAK